MLQDASACLLSTLGSGVDSALFGISPCMSSASGSSVDLDACKRTMVAISVEGAWNQLFLNGVHSV